MHGKHEPHDAFVEKLEWQVAHEVRRRNRAAEAPRWMPRSRLQAALAAIVLMVVSMGIGGAAVAVAYQAQSSERRDLLISGLQRRLELARQRGEIAAEQLQSAQGRVSVGTASRQEVFDAGTKVAEAQAELKSIQLQLEEVRITGREPGMSLSAPRVSGRDFVTERMRIESAIPEAALEAARSQLTETVSRVDVGTADPDQVVSARGRVVELEAAFQGLRGRMEIRQKFLKGEMDAAETELRALEAEADVRKKVVASQLEVAKMNADRTRSRFEVGTAQSVEVAKARLRVQELETDMAKAELDLALVRDQLTSRKAK
jgi:outer membrane protein TolC